MLPVTPTDMRDREDKLRYLLERHPKSKRLQDRLRNLQIKMVKASIRIAKFYSIPSNIKRKK
jgi:hypothetical protein